VAKNPNIVIVKIYPIEGRIRPSRVIAAWGVIANNIVEGNLQGNAVVTIAMGSEQSRT